MWEIFDTLKMFFFARKQNENFPISLSKENVRFIISPFRKNAEHRHLQNLISNTVET